MCINARALPSVVGGAMLRCSMSCNCSTLRNYWEQFVQGKVWPKSILLRPTLGARSTCSEYDCYYTACNFFKRRPIVFIPCKSAPIFSGQVPPFLQVLKFFMPGTDALIYTMPPFYLFFILRIPCFLSSTIIYTNYNY